MCRVGLCLGLGIQYIEGTCGKIDIRCLHVFLRGMEAKNTTDSNTYDTREPRSKE